MYLDLSPHQQIALRKVAGAVFRDHAVDLDNFEPHRMDWKSLNSLEAGVVRRAKDMLGEFKSASDGELQDLERGHESLMKVYDAIAHEKDARSKAGNRGPRESSLHPMVPVPPDVRVRAVDDGRPLDEEPAETSVALRPQESLRSHLRRANPALDEYRGLSVGGFMRAMVLGPETDLERRALTEGTDSAGGYTVPTILSAQLIDMMRAKSTVMAAGARTVPLDSKVTYYAKLLTDPVPAWRNEEGAFAESDPTFGRITFTARSLGVIVKVSRELMEDSLNIAEALPNVIAKAMAAEVDRVALLGSGVAPRAEGRGELLRPHRQLLCRRLPDGLHATGRGAHGAARRE